ncbi:hypothetical protein SOHN41_01260 [Shewanella sp. HN-41]|nr:hypothetical protein SOHN41_01260 [Shewanella sp. HN-41]
MFDEKAANICGFSFLCSPKTLTNKAIGSLYLWTVHFDVSVSLFD